MSFRSCIRKCAREAGTAALFIAGYVLKSAYLPPGDLSATSAICKHREQLWMRVPFPTVPLIEFSARLPFYFNKACPL